MPNPRKLAKAARFVGGTAMVLSCLAFGTLAAAALDGGELNGRGAALTLWPLTFVLLVAAPGLALIGVLVTRATRKHVPLSRIALTAGAVCFGLAILGFFAIAISPAPGI